MAKLYFRYGAMNSGKSTLLLQVAHNYEERGMRVLLIKPLIDTKESNYLVSRLGIKRKIDWWVKREENIYDRVNALIEEPDCILVDEAQFLGREQVDQLLQVVIKKNIPVICYGIRLDFQGNGFEGSTRLLEIAHTIEEIKTICRCGRKAMVNARLVNGKFTFMGDQVAIDGLDHVEYEPLCAHCYYEKKDKWERLQKNLR